MCRFDFHGRWTVAIATCALILSCGGGEKLESDELITSSDGQQSRETVDGEQNEKSSEDDDSTEDRQTNGDDSSGSQPDNDEGSDNDGDSGEAKGDGDEDSDAEDGEDGGENEEPIDLTGTWAEQVTLTGVLDLPQIGEVEVETTQINRLRIEASQGEFDVESVPCSYELSDDSSAADLVVPEAFERALSTRNYSGSIEGETVQMQSYWQVFGADLEDPETEALPTTPDGETVNDADRDENPGVTLEVSGLVEAQLYIAQKRRISREGSFSRESDRIEGEVEWSEQINILETDHSAVGSRSVDSSPHSDASKSRFVLQRLEQQRDCSEILQNRDDIFR